MTFLRVLLIGGLLSAVPLRAVYAPIPEQDQGKDLVFSARAGLAYDSNVFGAASGEIDSYVWTFAPGVTYNVSLTPQTFFSAAYGLTLDRFTDRPGDKLLDSHEANVRVAHAFSPKTTLDVNNAFSIARNPEALLPGIVLNQDQSYTRNQLDGRFSTAITPKIGTTVKARSMLFRYRNDQLSQDLDRVENLYGLTADYAVLPEVKAVAEYRHQDVFYRTAGNVKDKRSEFLMGGVDYDVARKLSLSGRLGAEWRDRSAEADTTAPYAELTAKYDYARSSFLSGGYVFTLEETSDTRRFTDSEVHRFFVSGQHSVSALIVLSSSLTYETSELQGRRGLRDVAERTLRGGAALSYVPTKNWTLTAAFDHDRVRSDDPNRELRRNRFSLGATFSF